SHAPHAARKAIVISTGPNQHTYPVAPRPLPDAEEIALAMSAAPPAISAHADVYAVRTTGAVKIRAGTNGLACMVIRDPHPGSLYPMCFDREAVKSAMRYEFFRATLRAKGTPEAQIEKEVEAAYARGELRMPTKPAISYMMSPQQILFTSPYKEGRRLGAWHPHLMISMPGTASSQLGMDSTSQIDVMQLDRPGKGDAQLIVRVPHWANGMGVGS
ncbi:MAG: hypothetical protein M3081_10775, partial [Gemmatimonadota bacterium]|nr:hypothetical protein [Gemmatimonadota bacterium]